MDFFLPNTARKIYSVFSIRSEFLRNSLTLTIGSTLSQVFPILFYPILSRMFSPAQFGLFASLTAVTSIFAVIGSGKYESSILITPTKEDAANVIGFIILASGTFMCASSFLLLLFSYLFSDSFNSNLFIKWIFICPISAFSIIIFSCYNEWCVRNKYFNTLAINKITNTASSTLGKLFFGFLKLFNQGLILGDLIGRVFSAGAFIFRALKNDRKVFFQIKFANMWLAAKNYMVFPKYNLPDQLLGTLGVLMPIFLIGTYFNSIEVGFYSMAMNIITVPVTVISFSLKDVFRQRANEEFVKYGHCKYIYRKLLKVLTVWAVIGSVILYFILPHLFSFVLGSTWHMAGVYSQILLPMIALSFISNSLSGVLIISQKMRVSMYWQLYYFIITASCIVLAYNIYGDIKSVLILFALGRSTAYIIYILLSYKYSGLSKAISTVVNL